MSIGIPIIKKRQSYDSFIYIMEIPIPGKTNERPPHIQGHSDVVFPGRWSFQGSSTLWDYSLNTQTMSFH